MKNGYLTTISLSDEGRWMKWSVAAVWLAGGLLVVHPYYRQVGSGYLVRLGLPGWVMGIACLLEVILGLRVAFGAATSWLWAVQTCLIVAFTTVLTRLEPMLLLHPFGVLSKNVPLLALIGTSWLLEREGWTPRAIWLLRAGMAAVWITEGLFPKILFHQPMELAIVARSGLVPGDPAAFLRFMGLCQLASGIAVLVLRGRPLRFILWCQVIALLLLPILVSVQDPFLWVHPFAPLVKNIPIIAGTAILARRC